MNRGDLERRIEHAMEMHERNFNCAQCVALACADLGMLDEVTAFKMLEGFGGGMGAHAETCGAISGGIAVISNVMSDGPHNPTTKMQTYAQVRKLPERFGEKVGSTICADIKGETGGEVLQSCEACIADCIELTMEILEELERL